MTDLRERFERDLADLHPTPGYDIAVLSRGRRLRARRRAGQAAGAVVATAAAGAVVVSLLGGSNGTASDLGIATEPTPSTPSAVTDAAPTGWWDMPVRRMVTVLEDALPDEVTADHYDLYMETGNGLEKATGVLLGILTADTGPGTFQVLLYPPDPTEPLPDPVTTTGADGFTDTTVQVAGEPLAERIKCRGYMTTCEPLLDDSGAVIGRVSTDTDQGTTYYEVALLGPDGGGLNLTVMDSSGEKPGYQNPSASAPPLTTGQLVALARDAAWTSYVPKDPQD